MKARRPLPEPGVVIVVSDLHLAEAPTEGRADPCSRAFADFAEGLTSEVLDGVASIDLVMLGDMLDLTQIVDGASGDEAIRASSARLQQIASTHANVFESLGRFVASGGRLHIVLGNHDLDLAHPALQRGVLQLLGVPSGQSAPPAVTFHPWSLYIPRVLYAEHGHRYHDINSVRVPDGRTVPGIHAPDETPWAAYLERWFSAIRARTGIEIWTRELLKRTFSGVRPAPGLDLEERASDELGSATLIAIDRLTARVGLKTLLRVASIIFSPLARVAAPYALGATVAGLILRGHRRAGRVAAGLIVITGVASLIRAASHIWPPPRSTGYALHAARALDTVLARAGNRVPIYVLGHTHIPARIGLGPGGGPPIYMNTGSWTLRARSTTYPFLRVTRDPAGDVRGELLWWPSEGDPRAEQANGISGAVPPQPRAVPPSADPPRSQPGP